MIVGIQTNGTNGIGKINVGNAKMNSIKNRAEEKASDTFAGLMNLTSQTVQTEDKNVPSSSDVSSISSVKPAFSVDGAYSGASEKIAERKTDNQTDIAKNESEAQKVPKTETEQTKKSDDADGENQIDSDVNEAKQETPMDKAQKELADKIMQLLGIDDEKLQQLLAQTGLSMQELLNPEVLQQFVLQINDASSVDMLIDENLNQTVNQILNALDEVLTANGIAEADLSETVLLEEEGIEISVDSEESANVNPKQKAGDNEQPDESIVTGRDSRDAVSKTQNTLSEVKVTVQSQNAEYTGGQGEQMNQNTDTILANLNQAVTQAIGNDAAEVNGFSEQITQADILRQVVDEIKLTMSRDINSLSVQLNPEQLGKVQIHVVTKNGVMQAQIIAENEAAKNAVESGISVLREAFENQDLKVDAIEVMVGTRDFFAENEQNTQDDSRREKTGNQSGGININEISDDEISESEQLEAEMMKAQGNRVNYTA
ncbi:MAG: flagellar hook-length control protein FliK [Wujia sp.]